MESKGISNELLLKQFNIKESIQTTESFQWILKSLPKDNPKKLKDKNCSVIDKTNFTPKSTRRKGYYEIETCLAWKFAFPF